jgi:hypothetical protein
MQFKLLTRDQFREQVFARDKHRCVICDNAAVDAHHIIERRLFSDGGYYLENGASLCERHHIEAEQTVLSCQQIREAIGIERFPIPEHFYSDVDYDKWGNIIVSGGRLKGELFFDPSVQKILGQGNVLDIFMKQMKYQRTYHLPWSNPLKDDRQLADDSVFTGKEVVATLKMDGENTTMYNDYIHARSLDYASRPDRSYIKGMWGKIAYLIDENMRICGENLYAVHVIQYRNLPSYFMTFSIWIENRCLSWDETVEYAKILGLEHVPVIYRGIYDKKKISEAFAPFANEHEGYVIRTADEFLYHEFRRCVAKYVRKEFKDLVNNSHGQWLGKRKELNSLA